MIRRPPRSTQSRSSAASDVYKRQTDALPVRPGGGVRLRSELCIGCHNCAEACPFGAVLWDPEQNKPEICVYCGYCVAYCPYDVLGMEDLAASAAAPAEEASAGGVVHASQ